MSNGKSIPKKSSKPGSKTATSTTHPSGPIYVPSTAPSIEDWLTSLRQDSPASPTQSQDNGREKQTSETSGLILRESSMRWDRDMSCWRTSQASFMEMQDGLPMGERLSENFPRWGTTVNGELWEQEMPAHPTSESGGGASGWATPQSRDYRSAEGNDPRWENPDRSRNLNDQVAFEVRTWATPTTRDWKDGSDPSPLVPTNWLLGRQAPRTETVGQESSPSVQNSPRPSPKRLNPNFVEWLMGLPIGWTDLKPLETESYHQWYENFSGGL